MARVLVVDDEEGVRSFLAETLESDGHAVTRAEDGAAALAALARDPFDLVLTDLSMPGVDGMEVLRRTLATRPEAAVIVLTARGTVETAVEALRLGAHDYLRKPVGSPAELRLRAARALASRALPGDPPADPGDPLPPLSYGDPAMTPVVEAIRRVARTDATVLLLGESGTGKEVAARSIHAASSRRAGPFVAVNCAALSEALLESELFGHEKGAFTGAAGQRRGRIEQAEGGTFFLDEVGELRPHLQAKLLRVLQERRFERVGGGKSLPANVRFIAATNRDLTAMIAGGAFREDLYHRIAVFPLRLPPLRERRADIAPLADALLSRIGPRLGRGAITLSAEARARLRAAPWPGNVRELTNTLERAAILSDGPVLSVECLGLPAAAPDPAPTAAARALTDIERDAIAQALAEVSGNRRKAAERLGIGLRTLYEKIKRYGLS